MYVCDCIFFMCVCVQRVYVKVKGQSVGVVFSTLTMLVLGIELSSSSALASSTFICWTPFQPRKWRFHHDCVIYVRCFMPCDTSPVLKFWMTFHHRWNLDLWIYLFISFLLTLSYHLDFSVENSEHWAICGGSLFLYSQHPRGWDRKIAN